VGKTAYPRDLAETKNTPQLKLYNKATARRGLLINVIAQLNSIHRLAENPSTCWRLSSDSNISKTGDR
jgi:hypothetical protein